MKNISESVPSVSSFLGETTFMWLSDASFDIRLKGFDFFLIKHTYHVKNVTYRVFFIDLFYLKKIDSLNDG